jgi:hypothetical protein
MAAMAMTIVQVSFRASNQRKMILKQPFQSMKVSASSSRFGILPWLSFKRRLYDLKNAALEIRLRPFSRRWLVPHGPVSLTVLA